MISDVDECNWPNGTNSGAPVTASPFSLCGYGALCVNKPGSYQCVCPAGYSGDPQTECTDINECGGGAAVCGVNAKCLNLPGSFKCICPPGYQGNAVEFCNS